MSAAGPKTGSPTGSPSSTATASPSPAPGANGAVLHLDHQCLVDDNPPPTTAHFPPGDPFGTDISDLGNGAELQRLYAVQKGSLVPADNGGPVRPCDQQLWQVVAATAPADVLAYVDELLVFDADLSGGADTSVGEVVSLKQSTERSSHWRLSLAPNGATDVDVAITVAHEVGHLVSLGAKETTGQSEQACTGTFVDGCLRDDAALLSFLDDTWSKDEWDAWDTADATSDDAARQKALQTFYDQHAGSFVDEYAATHPAEDFAETFALWCAIGPQGALLPDVVQGAASNGAAKLAWFDRPGNRVAAASRSQCEQLRQLTR